jgi:large subunit ribosomal protein L17
MFRNMVTSLFKYDRIRTTDIKAKELSRWAEKLITLAKQGGLHARRQALSIIREKDVVHKLFEQARERFADRNGGHIRIVKADRRPGDAAPISIVELVGASISEKKKETGKTIKAKKKSGGKTDAGKKEEKKNLKTKKDEASKETDSKPEGSILEEAAPTSAISQDKEKE